MADERITALERIFARPFSPIEYEGWAALVDQGVTPELVRAVYQKALTERRTMPAKYTLCHIRDNLAPYEVKTPTDWETHLAAQKQAAADRQSQWSKAKKPASNVFLRRDEAPKGDEYYDHIYKKFET